MKSGFLSQYFQSVAVKKLTAVEIDTDVSNQHEFNGTRELKRVFGEEQPKQFNTKFISIGENSTPPPEEGIITWYDSRQNHPKRSEYRLYFQSNEVTKTAKVGDSLFIALRPDQSALMVIAEGGSTIEQQLYWLFGLENDKNPDFKLSEISSNDLELNISVQLILDELGLKAETDGEQYLDSILTEFNGQFPSTSIFSKFARKTLPSKVDVIEDPDDSIIAFMTWEEKLFRRLEWQNVRERIENGFTGHSGADVDGFIEYSKSIQNRRKARVGHAFEDHLTYIFLKNGLKFSRKKETEHKSKPDFLFPGINEYNDHLFPQSQLTMAGAKTSCKDRWRQVLSEASKITTKHIITLEPGISENQTNEMKGNNVQLILPQSLMSSFTANQQIWLVSLYNFIQLLITRQAKI